MARGFHLWISILITLVLALPLSGETRTSDTKGRSVATLKKKRLAQKPTGISAKSWKNIQRRIQADRYRIGKKKGEALANQSIWQASNHSQAFKLIFTPKGLSISPRRGKASWQWGMEMVGYGREGSIQIAPKARVVAQKNRLEYRRGGVTEWYINDRRGVEQGFTLQSPPQSPDPKAPLAVELALFGELKPQVDSQGKTLTLHDASGRQVLR
jgi:hypothetical protein